VPSRESARVGADDTLECVRASVRLVDEGFRASGGAGGTSDQPKREARRAAVDSGGVCDNVAASVLGTDEMVWTNVCT
jgi:hypothetical protein